MPRKQHKYHFIYKTTCIVTGRYYIGMHSTSNLEDGYIGSGRRLWLSINKNGKENHNIEILEFLPDRETLKKREAELITEKILNDHMCINLALGGGGGFISKEAQQKRAIAGGIARSIKLKENLEFKKEVEKRNSKLFKRLHKEGKIKPFDWTGKNHTFETKEKMSKSHKGLGVGERNSQYGTMWITNGIENKKIKASDIIPKGWKKGRKI